MKLRQATVRDIDAVVDLVTAMLQEMAAHGGHALGEETQARSWLRARLARSLGKEDHLCVVTALEERQHDG
jgi:hypothetical protein